MPAVVRRWSAAFGAVVLAGCSLREPTSLTQVWSAPIDARPMRTVIVFAAHMDEADRRALEDGYVEALAQHGVTARPSHALFPGEPPRHDTAREAVSQAGFEGILVSAMRGVREPQTFFAGVAGQGEGGFWEAYYGPGWDYWTPGYSVAERLVGFDTTLWDARAGGELVFGLTTETTNPSLDKSFVMTLTATVVPALEKQKLISRERK